MTALSDIARHSVTKSDAELLATQGKVIYLSLPPMSAMWSVTGVGPLPPDLPPPWSRYRDRWLSATLLAETMWAAAVSKAITKRTARGWTVKDSAKSERRTKFGQTLFLTAQNGAGWVPYMTRTLRDFILADNGSVGEIVRATSAAGSRILGIMHLDTMRCWRTGDAQWPIIYEDLLGGMHPLRDYQVLSFVDMESPRAESRGTGLCAASRAYQTIYKQMVLEQYINEKLDGTSPKEVHLVNGIDSQQFEDAISTAQEQRRRLGNMRYQGVVVIPAIKMDVEPGGYRIPISEIPEGWSAKEERDNSYVKYANCLGVPVQDIQPLSGQGLGTGTQTVMLAEAAEGEGLAAFDKQWEHQVNDRVLPTATTFVWTAHDLRDQEQKATIGKTRADMLKILVEIGTITAQQAAQLAADAGDIPDSFLPQDETPTDELTDSEKDPGEQAAVDGAAPLPAPVPVAPVPATKARRLTIADLDAAAALDAAQALVAEVAS